MSTDMSGVIADTVGRGSVVAAELAVSDAGGTVLGRPIEIVSADHQLKPDVGLTIARRWFDEEHVEAIADIPVSTIALGIQNLVRTKGKIALISGAGTLDLYGKSCSPTGFVWTFDTSALPRAPVLSAAESGVKKWFVVGPDYSFGHQMERAVADVVKETGGQLVGTRRAAIGTSDYASSFWPRRKRDRTRLPRLLPATMAFFSSRTPLNSACCRRECAWRA